MKKKDRGLAERRRNRMTGRVGGGGKLEREEEGVWMGRTEEEGENEVEKGKEVKQTIDPCHCLISKAVIAIYSDE